MLHMELTVETCFICYHLLSTVNSVLIVHLVLAVFNSCSFTVQLVSFFIFDSVLCPDGKLCGLTLTSVHNALIVKLFSTKKNGLLSDDCI